MNTEIVTKDRVEGFITLLAEGEQKIYAAAALLAEMVREDAQVIERIAALAPTLSRGLLNRLLRVGEGSLAPALLMGGRACDRALTRLPVEVQKRVLDAERLYVVTNLATGDGLMVALGELDTKACAQVFGPEGVRDREEQMAWLKRRAVAARPVGPASVQDRVVVRKDRIVVLAATEDTALTKADLLRYLGEIG